MLNEIYTFETIDSYLAFFYERVESFFDYFMDVVINRKWPLYKAFLSYKIKSWI